MPLLNEADTVYLGDVAVDAVYLGDALVWPQPDFTAVLETMAEDGKTAFHVDGTFLPGPHTVLLTDPNGLADSIADTDAMEIVGTVVPPDAFGGVIMLSPNTWSHYKPLVGQVITVEGFTQPVGDQTVYTVKVPSLMRLDPDSIAGLDSWYDLSDTSTMDMNGQEVTALHDKAASDRTLQATGALTVSGDINGTPVVHFDGQSDFRAQGLTHNFSDPVEVTIFVVAQLQNHAESKAIQWDKTATALIQVAQVGNDGHPTFDYSASDHVTRATSGSGWNGQLLGLEATRDSSGRIVLADSAGTELRAIDNTDMHPTVVDSLYLGKDAEGDIGEVIVYAAHLSEADRRRVWDEYLLPKWMPQP